MTYTPPEFRVTIPDDRIAQHPPERRGDSRLLVVDRLQGRVVHVGRFPDVARIIRDDLLILNETRVLPVRVEGEKPGGGKVQLLFVMGSESVATGKLSIRALVSPWRRLVPGLAIKLLGKAYFTLIAHSPDGGWLGEWEQADRLPLSLWLERYGSAPLPPYIKRKPEAADRERYQTVYAREAGSIAAPTAGLHFTDELLNQMVSGGCSIAKLTLDVGWGTFEPLHSADFTSHKMHGERYSISGETVEAIRQAKAAGRKVTAVGTTSVRALEDAALRSYPITEIERVADIFIRPPHDFRVVDRLITNFHRPDSTLLLLVASLIGWDLLNEAYQRAVDEGFRFFSYGDAMVVL